MNYLFNDGDEDESRKAKQDRKKLEKQTRQLRRDLSEKRKELQDQESITENTIFIKLLKWRI